MLKTNSLSRSNHHIPAYKKGKGAPKKLDSTMHIWAASVSTLFPGSGCRVDEKWPQDMEEHQIFTRLFATLSPGEKEQLSRFRVRNSALLFLTARAMTRILAHHYEPGCLGHYEEFSTSPLGKPFFSKTILRQPLYFNISHSWPWAVVGFTRKAECGVDVEMIDHRFRCKELYASTLHAREMRTVYSAASPDSAFIRIWTRKEAAAKTVGLGLHWNFKEFSIRELDGTVAHNDEQLEDVTVRTMPSSCLGPSPEGFLSAGCRVAPKHMPKIVLLAFDPFAFDLTTQ